MKLQWTADGSCNFKITRDFNNVKERNTDLFYFKESQYQYINECNRALQCNVFWGFCISHLCCLFQ